MFEITFFYGGTGTRFSKRVTYATILSLTVLSHVPSRYISYFSKRYGNYHSQTGLKDRYRTRTAYYIYFR